MRRLAPLVLLVLAALSSQTARACLAEYRSVEWMAETSRLAFVGRIEKVDPVANGGGEYQIGVPAVATVRIVRMLRGKWRKATIEIMNGPVPS
ncbi:MAG: hypothetical protein K8T20_10695 [Planctomycetes bacterium]|nr:hypothetical protein [Planctomycetota bacterium]